MTDERWRRAKELFHQSLEQPEEEREAFLDRACGGDTTLRDRVAGLLRAHESDEGLLSPPPEHIGPYRVIEELGTGGFGTVYRAEQSEPVRREVALKIVKLGMDTREIIARFEAERQALAMMSHPGIAQVHDAGATEQGRPYFVMELVEGLPITEFCAPLGTRQRLALFMQVCHAIQHAHMKGIVHRDIKPSNILVSMDEGVPVPKVIDFGIAKAVGPRLTERTFETSADQMLGTPDYMSPEQAQLAGVDVDTRSDVYSLGAVLYELLTGSAPFDLRRLLRSGYLEAMRCIREDDPPKPSTRATSRLLRGDLDWIVMKSLEKDRARRYETASALAADIGRYLRNEPVEAGPPSASYRVRKFVRRHRTGVVAAALVLVALVAGLAMATLGFMEAREQRDVAQTEALRANTVVRLIRRAFTAIDPHRAHGAGYTVRDLLVAFDRDLGDSLASEPDVEITIRLTMGEGFRLLGLRPDAERHIARALELCREQYGDEDPRTLDALSTWGWVQHDKGDLDGAAETFGRVLAMRRRLTPDDDVNIARALNAVTDLHRHAGNWDEGVKTGEQILAIYRARGSGASAVPIYLASIYLDMGRQADAESLYREILTNLEERLGKDHPRSSRYLGAIALIHRDRGEFTEAEEFARRVLAIDRKYGGARSRLVALSLMRLGTILTRAGNRAAAEPILVEADGIAREVGEGLLVRSATMALGDFYRDAGNYKDAERLLKECLEVSIRQFGEENARVGQAKSKLGAVYYYRRQLGPAEKYLRESVESMTAAWGADHHDVLVTTVRLGRVLYRTNRAPDAEKLLVPIVEKLRRLYPTDRAGLADALNALAISIRNQGRTPLEQLKETYELNVALWGEDRSVVSRFSYGSALSATGKYAEAEPVLRGAYETSRRTRGPANDLTVKGLKSYANCLDRQKKHAQAEPLWVELLEQLRSGKNKRSELGSALVLYGLCMTSQNKYAEAEPLLAECLKIREEILPEGHWLRYDTMSLLGGCLTGLKKFEQAEPLLVEAHKMKPPPNAAHYKKQAKDRIVRLYEAWGKPDKAKEWRAKE